METARVRVTRTERPDIIKRKKSSEKKKKSETNGDVVVFNGDLAHSAKSGEQSYLILIHLDK
jgi:ectoine hydroxylase-related dioxygenase (phytanoyl-CoA dioxygenase family)